MPPLPQDPLTFLKQDFDPLPLAGDIAQRHLHLHQLVRHLQMHRGRGRGCQAPPGRGTPGPAGPHQTAPAALRSSPPAPFAARSPRRRGRRAAPAPLVATAAAAAPQHPPPSSCRAEAATPHFRRVPAVAMAARC